MQPAAAELNYRLEDFPMSLYLSKCILSLALYLGLTNDEQNYVTDLMAQLYK